MMQLFTTPPEAKVSQNSHGQGVTVVRPAVQLTPSTQIAVQAGFSSGEVVAPRSQAVPAPNSDPVPSDPALFAPQPKSLHQGARVQESGLTVRGLRLGSHLGQVRQQFGNPESYQNFEKGSRRFERAMTTGQSFGSYSALFDRSGVLGAANGNGLERFGKPVLACGEGANEVVAVLGPPDGARYPYFGRGTQAVWEYLYEGFDLTIWFRDGKVERFRLRETGFVDSFC